MPVAIEVQRNASKNRIQLTPMALPAMSRYLRLARMRAHDTPPPIVAAAVKIQTAPLAPRSSEICALDSGICRTNSPIEPKTSIAKAISSFIVFIRDRSLLSGRKSPYYTALPEKCRLRGDPFLPH